MVSGRPHQHRIMEGWGGRRAGYSLAHFLNFLVSKQKCFPPHLVAIKSCSPHQVMIQQQRSPKISPSPSSLPNGGGGCRRVSPLISAAHYGRLPLVRLLLAAPAPGCDPLAADEQGLPRGLSCGRGHLHPEGEGADGWPRGQRGAFSEPPCRISQRPRGVTPRVGKKGAGRTALHHAAFPGHPIPPPGAIRFVYLRSLISPRSHSIHSRCPDLEKNRPPDDQLSITVPPDALGPRASIHL